MRININESGISFNRDSGGSTVLDESVLKEIEERLKNINDKVEYSDKIPTDEDIVIWINPEEDPAQEYLIRINDETVASNTVWSSEKVHQQINSMFIQADSHIHFNKDVLDKITEKDIVNWNSKSNFDGSYKSLTDKPMIPSIEGLASEEYVNEAIENLQLPSNLATIEDIPTKLSELENDSSYITDIELEEELDSKGYLTEHQDLSEYAKTKDIPTKVSELENDSNYAMLSQIHQHENKDVLDSITSSQIEKWDNYTEFDGDYNSLINKPYIPQSTNDLVNNSGFISEIPDEYITEYQLLQKNYAKKENIPTKVSELENDSNYISEIPSEYITETELEDKRYLTEHQDISNLATKEELFNKDYNDLINKPNIPSIEGLASEEYVDNAIENIPKIDLSEYATKEELHEHENKNILDSITEEKINSWNNKSSFDGNYNNLTNKPNIPTHTSELQNDSGFISEIPNEYITETELENVMNSIEKTVSSDTQPTEENVTLWVNTSEDETTTVTRINDETVASNTTWSSEKVNTLINSLRLIKEGNVVKLMLGDIELSNINI